MDIAILTCLVSHSQAEQILLQLNLSHVCKLGLVCTTPTLRVDTPSNLVQMHSVGGSCDFGLSP